MQITYNWAAVSLSTLLGVVIHLIWYSPLVLGKAWQRLSGLDDEAAKAGLLPRVGLAALASLALAVCLGGFFNFTGSNTFGMGALAALQLWAGLLLPFTALESVGARRPAGLLAINLGASLLMALLAGGLLASWR